MATFSVYIFLQCLIFMQISGIKGHTFLKSPPVSENSSLPPEQWFVQKLDHLDPTNIKTWKQRYFVNETFYKPGGPIFLMIGGEGPASPKWMVTGSWIDYAEKLGAICFQLEHRFYGESHPTEDARTENLIHLNSELALADLAYFSTAMREKWNLKDNLLVAFGGSYPGSLAGWFRLKYPHIVHASVASSAPVLAKIDFTEYLEVVANSLEAAQPGCSNLVQEATRELRMLLQHRIGWRTITKEFKLCNDLDATNMLDVSNLFATLTDNFNDVVQYNKDNREFEGAQGTNVTIETLCTIMANKSIGSAFERYGVVNSLMLNVQEEECLDFSYKNYIQEMRNVSWEGNDAISGRTWIYQTCTEFGFYQSTDSSKQPFGDFFPVDFFTQQCTDIFGERFTKDLIRAGVARTNMMYGGLGLKVSRVIFPNGSIDPWHALGVTRDLSPDAPAVFINGTAHCANMYPSRSDDPPQLLKARQKVFSKLQTWLNVA